PIKRESQTIETSSRLPPPDWSATTLFRHNVTAHRPPGAECQAKSRRASTRRGNISLDISPHRTIQGLFKIVRGCAGLNRHVVGEEGSLQERRKRLHPGPESCGGNGVANIVPKSAHARIYRAVRVRLPANPVAKLIPVRIS